MCYIWYVKVCIYNIILLFKYSVRKVYTLNLKSLFYNNLTLLPLSSKSDSTIVRSSKIAFSKNKSSLIGNKSIGSIDFKRINHYYKGKNKIGRPELQAPPMILITGIYMKDLSNSYTYNIGIFEQICNRKPGKIRKLEELQCAI